MTGVELYRSPDHMVWARHLCQAMVARGFDPNNAEHIEWLGGWIANAMMNGYDRAHAETESYVQDAPI